MEKLYIVIYFVSETAWCMNISIYAYIHIIYVYVYK